MPPLPTGPLPDDAFERACALIEAGEGPAAAALLDQLVARDPAHAAAWLELSYLASLDGAYRRAQACALHAFEARPGEPAVVRDLLKRLRTFNQADALHAVSRRFPPSAGTPLPLLLEFTLHYSHLNDEARALAYAAAAVEAAPMHPGALAARGQVLTHLGRFAEAEADFRAMLGLGVRAPSVLLSLARLRRQRPDDNHARELRAILASPAASARDVADAAFALHKTLDDLGDAAGAWAALERGCRAKRSLLDYHPGHSRSLVDALIREGASGPGGTAGAVGPATSALAARLARDANEAAQPADPIPVFIVGMHRSGTTLLEQLLEGHPQVRGVGEVYDFTSQMRWATDHHCRGIVDETLVERAAGMDLADAGARYLAGLGWRLSGERFVVDKLPSNFLNAGFICRALPQARILHMVRDPMETCFSNLRELFAEANPWSYDQQELAAYFLEYRRLMAHWHRTFPGRILDVEYARLTRDTEAVLRDVAAFCGFDYVPEMARLQDRTRAVTTASAVQVRGEVVARDTPKWAPYARWLQPLASALRAGGA